MSTSFRRCSSIALAMMLFLTACGGDGGLDVTDVTSVSVTPGSTTLVSLGATQQLSASANAAGTTVPDVAFTWLSSEPSVASVSASGLVTAVANGTATMSASATGGTASGTATITVAQAAATITLTIADETVTPGSTTQVTAVVVDAGGSDLAAPSLTWSSSDPTLATVDNAGLVTGVAEGQVVITASQDGASGTVGAGILRPDLVIDEDQTIGGAVSVGAMSVAAGVTVTLMEDAVIDANGPVTIAGTVTGDCTALSILGQDVITVSGTLNIACVATAGSGEDAPGLTISTPSSISMVGANVVTSGPIDVRSVAAAARSPGAAGSSRLASDIDLTGSVWMADPAEATHDGADPSAPKNGAGRAYVADGEILLNGSVMVGQHGAAGIPGSGTGAEELRVNGGPGGVGGDIVFLTPGAIRLDSSQGPTRLEGGNGAPGGPATGTTTENADLEKAPGVLATAGDGGDGGSVLFEGSVVGPLEVRSLVNLQVGHGGRGGSATATAADGVDANGTRDAQPGGFASATGGVGGNAGTILGDVFGLPDADPKEGGSGGTAIARSGKGGDGIRERPHGAEGGIVFSNGRRGGDGWEQLGNNGGDATATGGNGGNGADVCAAFESFSLVGSVSVGTDTDGSDFHMLNAGGGITLAIVYRILQFLGGPGGNGGIGADLSADSGLGGQNAATPGNDRGGDGVGLVGPGGNGGNGGAGVPPGSRGLGGKIALGGVLVRGSLVEPVFEDGVDGGACGAPSAARPSLAVSIGAGAGSANVDRTIEINGTAPWVNVTGLLADDGTVSANGQGTVAGTPNIKVVFAGTYDEVTQTLQGTYSMDTESTISPGHPVVYNVNVSGG